VVDEIASQTAAVDVAEDDRLRRSRFDDHDGPVTHVEARKLEHGAPLPEFTLHGAEAIGTTAVLRRAQTDLRAIVVTRCHDDDQPIE
jgi:hypothetical protein